MIKDAAILVHAFFNVQHGQQLELDWGYQLVTAYQNGFPNPSFPKHSSRELARFVVQHKDDPALGELVPQDEITYFVNKLKGKI